MCDCSSDTQQADQPIAVPTEGTAECVVMPGSLVDKAEAEAAGLFRDYESQRYWFCCAGCGPKFDADPARYTLA